MTEQLIGITEAAAILQCHVNTLRRWDNSPLIAPALVRISGQRRYRVQVLEQIMQGGKDHSAEVEGMLRQQAKAKRKPSRKARLPLDKEVVNRMIHRPKKDGMTALDMEITEEE